MASVRNGYHTKYLSDPSHSCQKVRKGIFGAGAAFVVLTGIVSELYYVSYLAIPRLMMNNLLMTETLV